MVIESVSIQYFFQHIIRLILHFSYQEYDEEEEEPLIFICTAPSALEAAIMWQANGIALDSSWRHKNEHEAPLTFLVTLDSQMKMIPSKCTANIWLLAKIRGKFVVSAMISSNIQEVTLTRFLKKVKTAVMEHAQHISGKACVL